jgi:hypothetical protein
MALKRWGWIWILAALVQLYLPGILFPKEEDPYGQWLACIALGAASQQLSCSCTLKHLSLPQSLLLPSPDVFLVVTHHKTGTALAGSSPMGLVQVVLWLLKVSASNPDQGGPGC